MSVLTEKNKLTNIILRAPEEYAQTSHTARQLTKGRDPPRELTVKELCTAMCEYYRARRTTRGRDQNNEMSLYAGDDSDGESTGSKRATSGSPEETMVTPQQEARDQKMLRVWADRSHQKRL